MTGDLARERALLSLPSGQAPRFAPRMAGCLVVTALCLGAPAGAAAQQVVFEGDAVPAPLSASPADATRGKAAFVQREHAEPLRYESEGLLALTPYVAYRSRGMPVQASIDGPARPHFEAGARTS